MPNTTSSANMSLPVPIVGVDAGPQYATDLNSCLTIIDSHNHSSGSGVQITPSGINISSDLTFSSNNATALRSLRFTSQSSAISGASDLGCLYETGVDLYYNDGNGNQIRLTSGGAVAGTPGSISGLSSPASASYNSGTATFIFQSAASTPGNIDAGSVIVREVVASGKGVTLSAPAGLSANYTMTFPAALPSSQKFMTVDSSGNIADSWVYDDSTLTVASNNLKIKDSGVTATQILDATITGAKIASQTITQGLLAAKASGTSVAAGGVAISASSGTFTTTSGTPSQITNFSVTITTTGRPVKVSMQNDASGNNAYVTTDCVAATSTTGVIYIKRGGVIITEDNQQISSSAGSRIQIPVGSYNFLDMGVNGSAGTYTYTMFASTDRSLTVNNAVLVAYEI